MCLCRTGNVVSTPGCLTMIFSISRSDDVRAVVAESLSSIVDRIATAAPEEREALLDALWGTLEDYDDLSAALSSVMTVLASYYALRASSPPPSPSPFPSLVPRVWPCLQHSIVSVRKQSFVTLAAILSIGQASEWLCGLQERFLRVMFQSILTENNPQVLDTAFNVWRLLVSSISNSDKLLQSLFPIFFRLASTRQHQKMDQNLLVDFEVSMLHWHLIDAHPFLTSIVSATNGD